MQEGTKKIRGQDKNPAPCFKIQYPMKNLIPIGERHANQFLCLKWQLNRGRGSGSGKLRFYLGENPVWKVLFSLGGSEILG